MIQNLLGHLALHRNLLGLLVLDYRFLLHGLREYLKYPEILQIGFSLGAGLCVRAIPLISNRTLLRRGILRRLHVRDVQHLKKSYGLKGESRRSLPQKIVNFTATKKPCCARTANSGRRLPDWRSVNADTNSLTAFLRKAAESAPKH